MTYVVGVDWGRTPEDATCVVQGERDADGVVTIYSVRRFTAGTWISKSTPTPTTSPTISGGSGT